MYDKHYSDVLALIEAIREGDPFAKIAITREISGVYGYTYIWHTSQQPPNHPGKKLRYEPTKLLWHKFCAKPFVKTVTARKLYDVLYTGWSECSKAMELLDSNEFQSVSYGSGTDFKLIRAHACYSPISFNGIQNAIDTATATLITKNGLSHALVEALANDTLVLLHSGTDYGFKFDKWHYVASPEDIAIRLKTIPVDQLAKQQETRKLIWQQLYTTRLKVDQYV